jgi:hypothetical protein
MNEGYRARRTLKHAAEKYMRAVRKEGTTVPEMRTIDLTVRIPRLTFISGKTHPQGNGGRKNRSGHSTEWAEAMGENGSRTFATEVDKALTPATPILIEGGVEL